GTVTVQARFPNPGGILRPGVYGKVRAVVRTIPEAILVPQRAVQELQGQYQVWVLGADDRVEPRFVEPGLRVDDLWVIASGLEPGDRIVVEGIQRLRSGMTVSAMPLAS
ncbi:MAG: efflux transporter periplasmic adaptor subunit, partial [Acidobacteriota bacterium]